MYYQLTDAMNRRFAQELRRYWQHHPRYRDIVDNIQGKYSFEERPSYGIIIKTGSGTRVDLSADNYVGIVMSHVYQAKYKNYPGVAVEWVREDAVAIQNNNGRFPSNPGVYFIELTEDEEFFVDPLLDVYREQVTKVTDTTYRVQHAFLDGTLRLFEMPAGFQLREPQNYTAERDAQGKPTGDILLTKPLTGDRWLVADYRWPDASTGPHKLYPMRANNAVIPGVVLAFGRRNEKGDRLAIVVQDIRRQSAMEYGGKWELTLDFDIMARDPHAQREIADQTVIYLWGILRSQLAHEGIEIMDVSLGGESEEVYDETGDDYFYNSSFSVTVQTEWAIHVPLNVFLRQAAPLTVQQAEALAGKDDDELAGESGNIKALESLGLEFVQDPFFTGRSPTYEVIR